MKTVYLVYKTDDQHSFASRDVIGVCTTKEQAIVIAKAHANKKQGEIFSTADLWNMRELNQTQGFRGDGEFHIEKVDTNKLI